MKKCPSTTFLKSSSEFSHPMDQSSKPANGPRSDHRASTTMTTSTTMTIKTENQPQDCVGSTTGWDGNNSGKNTVVQLPDFQEYTRMQGTGKIRRKKQQSRNITTEAMEEYLKLTNISLRQQARIVKKQLEAEEKAATIMRRSASLPSFIR